MAVLALIVTAMWAAAMACVVAGVWLLFGMAWALIAAGVVLALSAAIVRSSMVVRGD